jgi:hypothetical protein
MLIVSIADTNVFFECDECNKKESCNVSEATYNGAPMCLRCNTEMEMTHVEIGEIKQ